MKIIPVQEALQRKFQRQAQTVGLELHASGLCAHVGKLSPGCYWCYSAMDFSCGVQVGSDVGLPNLCNLDCAYCFARQPRPAAGQGIDQVPPDWRLPAASKEKILTRLLSAREKLEDFDIPSVAFAGDGAEPLLYLPVIREYMRFFKQEVEGACRVSPWYKLYTNGLLATQDVLDELRDLGLCEVRFHLGADLFSEEIYRHVGLAARVLPTVTVETPAWPPHRQGLFEMLPRINDLGVRHLNLLEVGVTSWNLDGIARALPQGELYHAGMGLFLDDGGLVYQIIAEVLRERFSFSVLDCNCLVKKLRDEWVFDRYYRDALRQIGLGKDWHEMGRAREQ
jgi:pyruvate formate-lyase activating enzyme-like uncharacterized protein